MLEQYYQVYDMSINQVGLAINVYTADTIGTPEVIRLNKFFIATPVVLVLALNVYLATVLLKKIDDTVVAEVYTKLAENPPKLVLVSHDDDEQIDDEKQ